MNITCILSILQVRFKRLSLSFVDKLTTLTSQQEHRLFFLFCGPVTETTVWEVWQTDLKVKPKI